MIEFISISVVSSPSIAESCSWYPWMPFVHMLSIAIFIGVAGIITMFGTVEFDLAPFPPLRILLHGAIVFMLVLSLEP